MPGRRSISLEPEELSVASPIRRSSRIKAIHTDSPAHKSVEKPAARRARRSQSIQSLNDYETEEKSRDESPSIKTKLTDLDKPSTPAKRTRRATSLQSEIIEDSETKPLRRTRKASAVQEDNEEEDTTPEVKGKPKKRVTRSVSKSPVDTKITKTSTATATRRYKLSLNKDGQETSKINALDIITENEDELLKSPEKIEETVENTSKSPNPKRNSLNDSNKIATVVLEKLKTSTIEVKTKTDIEDNIPEVPKSSEKNNEDEIIEIKEEIDIKSEIDEEETLNIIEENKEDNTSQNSGDFELFLDEENENKSPEKPKNNEDEEKTEKESLDSESTVILEIGQKEIDQISEIENADETLNKTIGQSENNQSIKSDHDSNISLVCEKGTIENTNTEITEDETNISIVGSGSSSPINVDATGEQNISLEEREQNLSVVNDDGKSYSAISAPENQLILDDSLDDVVESPNTSKKSVRETPSPKRLNKNEVETSPITRSRAKKLLEDEMNESITSNKSVDGTPSSKKSDKTTPVKRKSLVSDEDELPLAKIKSLNEDKNTNGQPEEISETTDLDVSTNSVKTSRRSSKINIEVEDSPMKQSDLNETKSSKINIEVEDSPMKQSKESDLNDTSRSSKRKSNKFDANEESENELDVSSKSVKKTPKKQSDENEDKQEDIIDAELPKKNPKRDSIRNVENESPDEQKSLKKTPKRYSIKNEDTDQQFSEFEESKLNISSKSAKNTPKRKSIKNNDENEDETTESELDVSSKSSKKTSKIKSIKNVENDNADQQLPELGEPELNISSKSAKNTPKRKSIKNNDDENADDASQEATEAELDVTSKSSKKTPKRQSIKNIENENTELGEPELNISSKSAKNTPKRISIKNTDENADDASQETIELNVSSSKKTPKRKSIKNNEDKNLDDQPEDTKEPELDVSSKSAKKTPKRKSLNNENSESPNKDKIKTPSEKNIKTCDENVNDDSDQENNSPNKLKETKEKDEGKSRDKMLDEYLASYTAEKKRKRELDESENSINHDDKKQRRSVPGINFSESGDESDDEDEHPNQFIDDMASEGSEDTPSIDSNEIIDEGESIGSTESEYDSDDDDYEHGSFIVDDDRDDELLSGDDDDHIEALEKAEKKKKRRVITISDSSDDEDDNQTDLDNLSMKPYGGMSPSSSINQISSVESDLESVKNKNEELSQQIEDGTRNTEEDVAEKSIIILEDSIIEDDKSKLESEKKDDSLCIIEEEKEEKDTKKLEEIENDKILLESVEKEILEIQNEENLVDNSEKEKIQLEDKNEKYKELLDKYFKQFDEDKKRNRRETIGESPPIQKEKLIKKDRRQSLGSHNIEESRQSFETYYEEIKEKQSKKKILNKEVSKRKSTDELNIVEEELIADILKPNKKSLSPFLTTESSLENQQESTEDQPKKPKRKISFEMNTSGTYLVSPLKNEDSAASKTNKPKSYSEDDETADLLKDFQDITNNETNIIDVQVPKILLTEALDSVEEVPKKKKKQKLDTSLKQFEELAEVEMFKTPIAYKSETLTAQQKKKLKKIKSVSTEFEDLSEVNMFQSPKINRVESLSDVEKVKSPLTKKKKKLVDKSEETQELPVENVKEKKQKKKKQDTEIIQKEISPAKDETVPKKKNKIEDISERLPTEIVKDKKKTKKHEMELSTPIPETEISPKDEKLSKKKIKVENSKKLSSKNEQSSKNIKIENTEKLPAETIEETKKKTKKLENEQTEIISAPKITQTAVSLEKKKLKKKKKSTAESSNIQTESDSSVKRQNLSSVDLFENEQTEISSAEPKITQSDTKKLKKKKKSASESSDIQTESDSSVKQQKLSSVDSFENGQTEISSAEPKITQTAVSLDKNKLKKKKKSTSESSDIQTESDSSDKRQKLSSVDSIENEQSEIISAEPKITQSDKKKRKKKKRSASESSDIQTESDSSVKRQKLSSVESDDSSFENKLPMKSEIHKVKKTKTASVDILKVNNENNISQLEDILIFKKVPLSTEFKDTVSKFRVKTAKIKPSKSEYMLYSKYFSNKTNKYKNLITPSCSGWTDPTVTVMNISQASHGIRKPKKKKEILKPSFAGNVNKFNVEELVNENLVTCSTLFKLHKK